MYVHSLDLVSITRTVKVENVTRSEQGSSDIYMLAYVDRRKVRKLCPRQY